MQPLLRSMMGSFLCKYEILCLSHSTYPALSLVNSNGLSSVAVSFQTINDTKGQVSMRDFEDLLPKKTLVLFPYISSLPRVL
jgi:hypothetical protein